MRSVIRPDKMGEPDDIVIDDVTCFRMERMDKGAVWIAAYRGDDRVAFWLSSKTKIRIALNENDLGCADDATALRPGIGDDEGSP